LFELVAKLLLTLVVGLGAPLLWVVVRAGRLAGWLLRPLLWFFERFVVLLERGYPRLVRWSLRNKAMVAVLALGGIVAAGRAALDLETELVPEMHQGEFTVEAALPVGTPLPETDRVIAPLDDTLRATVPHLAEVAMRIGSERDSNEAGERGEHTARIRVALGGAVVPDAPAGTPRRARLEDPRDAEEEALMAVRDAVRTIPDLRVHVSRPVLFSFKAPIEVEVRGYDLAELDRATRIVEDRLALIPGLRDVKGSILPGSPEIQITYDRDALSRAGLDIRKVAELVRDKVQGREATKYNLKDRKVPIRVRVQDIADASLQELRELVVNPGGTRPIPLQAVAELVVGRGPNEIRRIGQQRVGVVTANLQGVALGSTADAVREAIEGLRAELPPGVTTAVTGQSQEWERSSQSLYLALGLSVFLVYVIMASQFESLVHPLVILVSVPLALIGVVGALWALAIPVSIVVFLGVILLVGIVVNNAIVLVDYVNQLRERGMPLEEALVTAGRVRLRPILMTTLTTVLGLLPMALGLGDGSEIRIPMAVTVIAGLSFSTLLTLVVVPTLYAAVARFGEERSGSAARRLEEELSRVSAAQLAAKVEEEAP
jgi:HAE1 family hydrophobic/amphiphilic exporter-1